MPASSLLYVFMPQHWDMQEMPMISEHPNAEPFPGSTLINFPVQGLGDHVLQSNQLLGAPVVAEPKAGAFSIYDTYHHSNCVHAVYPIDNRYFNNFDIGTLANELGVGNSAMEHIVAKA
jgi:hypothetical protein